MDSLLKQRKHDIDWIRVLAFDLLILYHVGMFFVPWDWHIKNDVVVDWLRWPMIFVSQWRLPILFVVSGMGTRFAISSRSGGEYIRERISRLLIPLVAGILLIIPPQVYIERLVQGQFEGSFIQFYPHFFSGIYPAGNFSWHHLWFLPYLLIMSIVATPFFMKVRRGSSSLVDWLTKTIEASPFSLILLIIPLFIVEVTLEPFFAVTRALIGDWYAFVSYFVFFLSGFILISIGPGFWTALKKIRFHALVLGLVSFPTLLWLWMNVEISVFIPIFKAINMWSWILAIFAFASIYLNKKSPLLHYRNKAVYPFYILHQTITIFAGYFLMDSPIHFLWKMLVLVLVTYGGSWFIYEGVILRIPILHPLFGIKKPRHEHVGV